MGIKPIDVILTREITEKENISFCEEASNYLLEIVNFSTHVYHLFNSKAKDEYGENECVSIAMQLLQSIEIVDAIQELTKIGLFNPCTFYLRSLFEIYLNIRFLLEDSNFFIDRSLTWLFFCANQNIQIYDDISNEKFEKMVAENEIKISIDIEKNQKIANEKIVNLENLLNRGQFDAIRYKFQSFKKSPQN